MHHLNAARQSVEAARSAVPSPHPFRWLLLMAGLGIGVPLAGFGVLEAISLLGGWNWEFLGHPTGSSWALLALLVPLPFASLLLWWFLLVTRAPQSTFRRGLLAGLCGAITAFPLDGFLLGGALLMVANARQTVSPSAVLAAAVIGGLLGLVVPIISWGAWLWIGWIVLLGGLLGMLAGRQDRRLPSPASVSEWHFGA
jgi:hypothetical protein